MAVRQEIGARLGRGTLAVALLFGIVLMHGLGHPGENGPPGQTEAGAHAVAPHHAADATAAVSTAVSTVEARVGEGLRPAEPAPAHGAGAVAVCLAVLGAGAGVLLLAAAARGRLAAGDAVAVREGLAYALRGIPPPAPSGSVLTRLSSLRI
ncbi:DUF6153 family protein [Streptomyces sp. NPDC101115]|uniref:DUF6153 family protein n=1 Tax=Streptomyces sp. NPDC101115 TaxID=3366106 RepID=UPI00382AE0C1